MSIETARSTKSNVTPAEVRIQGRHFTCNGEPTRFRGVNLGNWLLLEAHMFGLPYIDHKIREAFVAILGADLAGRFSSDTRLLPS